MDNSPANSSPGDHSAGEKPPQNDAPGADSLARQQAAFAAHIRNPDRSPAPGDVEERRMAIYRDLFFRNLSNFIARSFPVLHRLYDKPRWERMIRAFFDDYRCHTPLFPEIPREFLQFLEQQRDGHPDDPPFALELAHYEWIETALDLDETNLEQITLNPATDLLDAIPVFSPLAMPLSYNYPVHQIRPDFQPDQPADQPTHLLVYRNRADQVRFMQLQGISITLVHRLKENQQQSGHYVLKALAAEAGLDFNSSFLEQGAAMLQDLYQRDVILGSR